jgi:4-oxalocrotonate tautomerase
MPYVRIEITDGATTEQKLQIYKETTEMLVRILNKKPEYTFVVIEEVDNKNWGHMGTSVALIREREAKERAAAAGAKKPKVKRAAAAAKAPTKRGGSRRAVGPEARSGDGTERKRKA